MHSMTKQKAKKEKEIMNNQPEVTVETALDANSILARDVANSVLVVSVLINLAVLIFWLALQVTNKYDQQVAQLLFG